MAPSLRQLDGEMEGNVSRWPHDAYKRHAILLTLKEWPDRSQTHIAEQIGCNRSTVAPRGEVHTWVTQGDDGPILAVTGVQPLHVLVT
jgi:hypothetical protein